MSDEKKARGSGKKSKKATETGKSGHIAWNDFKFINLELSKAQKEHVKGIDPSVYAIDEWLEGMLDDGHKLSVKLEKKSGAYFATLSGVEKTCPNYGLIMTSRAPTYMQSLLVLYFKCWELMDNMRWQSDSAEIDLWS